MNSCSICDKFNFTKECNFLYILDSLKAHYLASKNQIKEKDLEIISIKNKFLETKNIVKEKELTIISLKSLNTELNKKIVNIQKDHPELKRKKTNSMDSSSDLDAINIFRQVDLLENLNNNESLGLTYSENLLQSNAENQFSPVLHQNYQSPSKNTKNILSPIENKIDILQNKDTQNWRSANNNSTLLPKMLKNTPNKNSPNNEWISKGRLKENSDKSKNKINWGMSFIQPVKMNSSVTENIKTNLDSSNDIIACSQNAEKENKRKDRNVFKLKTKKRLKQSKLEFDKEIETVPQKGGKYQINETLCEDFIDASPVLKEVKPVRILRKFSRKNSDEELFDFKNVKKSQSDSMSTITQEEFDGIASTPKSASFPETRKREIKDEPLTVRKKLDENNKNKENVEINDSQLLEQDNGHIKKVSTETSSCLILPSQDDVVCIDDTDDVHFDVNTADLFIEMLRQEDQTQQNLKKMEKLQMENINKKKNLKLTQISALNRSHIVYIDSDVEDIDADATRCVIEEQKMSLDNTNNENSGQEIADTSDNLTTSENVFNSPDLKKNIPQHNCNECTAYKNYLIRTGCSESEIIERLKNCKKHKPLKLHLTPENFWEPRLLSFPENDPRREVLIDYRFANKSDNNEQ